ncbi:L-galactose dehydrogenase [Blattella germanica]|nr:L-galactose dehydrogenase [Blattella germanica]
METFVPGFHDEAAVRRMQYKTLGKTGLQVSYLSLGGGPFGGVSNYGAYEEEEAIATVHEALKQGINYIDTAPWYGFGRSEELLGKALKDVPRKAYYIATKVARYDKDPKKMFDFSKEKTLWSVDHSLKLLGLDYVDIVQSIVEAGKARYIGVTGYSVLAIKEVIERSPANVSMILSYTRDTLIDDDLKTYQPYFQSQGIGVVNAAGVSMGLLTNNGAMPWHPAPDNIKKACAEAGKYCKEKGVELGKLAMHYTFQQSESATHLVGMNTRQVLHLNLDLLYGGLSDLEKEVLQHVKTKYLDKIRPCNWENIEINELRQKLKTLS